LHQLGPNVAVCSIIIFFSGFYTGRNTGCYVGGLSKLHHKCVTNSQQMVTGQPFKEHPYKLGLGDDPIWK